MYINPIKAEYNCGVSNLYLSSSISENNLPLFLSMINLVSICNDFEFGSI